jgi:hypothetical protein
MGVHNLSIKIDWAIRKLPLTTHKLKLEQLMKNFELVNGCQVYLYLRGLIIRGHLLNLRIPRRHGQGRHLLEQFAHGQIFFKN